MGRCTEAYDGPGPGRRKEVAIERMQHPRPRRRPGRRGVLDRDEVVVSAAEPNINQRRVPVGADGADQTPARTGAPTAMRRGRRSHEDREDRVLIGNRTGSVIRPTADGGGTPRPRREAARRDRRRHQTTIMTDMRATHDAAYKQLFSQPRMVQDLLEGFAARGWSDALDLDSPTALPASYVGHDLRQRHGDLFWRVRFRDDRWLYLVLLLEFQSDIDRSMAVRMLTYTGLLHQG